MTPAATDFFQLGVEPRDRAEHGLDALFRQAFPVRDPARRAELVYVSYDARPPTDSAAATVERGATFAAALTLVLQLVLWSDEGSIRDIREQRVGTWEIAVPTPEGTFVIDGIELALDERALRRVHGDLVAALAGTAAARLVDRAGDDDLTPADLLIEEEG